MPLVAFTQQMLYQACCHQYFKFLKGGGIWAPHDFTRLSRPVAKVIKTWEKQVDDLDTSIPWDAMPLVAQNIACSFACHTLLPWFGKNAIMIEDFPPLASATLQHKRIETLAEAYCRSVAKYGARVTEMVYVHKLRGACEPDVNVCDNPKGLDGLAMMNEFELGVLVGCIFRNSRAPITDLLLQKVIVNIDVVIEGVLKCQARSANQVPVAPSEPVGKVREHEKLSRAPKWGGTRANVNCALGKKNLPASLFRSEEGKVESIAAEREHKADLRKAESARVEALWVRERIVSLGREIGGC